MSGPALVYLPDDDPSFKATGAWYCAIPGVSPGGYSTQDAVSGSSTGDKVTMKQSMRNAARRALQYKRAKKLPPLRGFMAWVRDLIALWLHFHEYLHCCVRLDENGACIPSDLERYSHPGTAKAGFLHALRRRFACNAFTRALRFRAGYKQEYADFLDWLESHQAILEA